MIRTTALLLSLLMTVGTAGAARAPVPMVQPATVVLAQAATSAEAVKAAIIRGGATRGWTVHKDEPGKLTLKYVKQNRHEVVLELPYDATGFQIRYVSSVEMAYEAGDPPRIHPFYNVWIANLSQAIRMAASAPN